MFLRIGLPHSHASVWLSKRTRQRQANRPIDWARSAAGPLPIADVDKSASDSLARTKKTAPARGYCTEAAPSRNHLNCGIVGALMRGGGGAATLAAFPTPLGSVLLNAPLSAPAFARPPPRFPVAVAPPPGAPPPRANEEAGVARTMNNAIANFVV